MINHKRSFITMCIRNKRKLLKFTLYFFRSIDLSFLTLSTCKLSINIDDFKCCSISTICSVIEVYYLTSFTVSILLTSPSFTSITINPISIWILSPISFSFITRGFRWVVIHLLLSLFVATPSFSICRINPFSIWILRPIFFARHTNVINCNIII